MPKKKTGQRKKAEKQRARQKEIRNAKDHLDLASAPCNAAMECEKCHKYTFNIIYQLDLIQILCILGSRRVGPFVISVKASNVYQSAHNAVK